MGGFRLYSLLLILLLACNRKEEKPPNILFILADDQCYRTVHELGNKEIITPTLDELAREGTVFTTAYNMGGWHGAICVASRTMFNTGKFLWRARTLENRLDTLAARNQLWSKEMERLGYETYLTGKWHVKIPPERLFDHVGTERPGMPGDSPEGYNRPLGPADTVWRPWDTLFGGYWAGGVHWSEVVADETIGFLEHSSRSEKPFFMYIAFNAPHDPRQSPKEFVDLYPLEQLSVPESYLPLYPQKDLIGCSAELRDEALAPFPRTPYAVKVNRQEYYALITHLDTQIERILQKLKETGQDKNTYIFYTADHGLSVGNHGLLGKQNMYDHSLRPPLIVVGPHVSRGKRNNAPVYIQDIMATALDYAGGKVPGWVEFHSLRSYIEGKDDPGYPAIYGAYMDLQRMIRKGDYKLIVYPKAGVVKLFNLSEDPLEINDLSSDFSEQTRISEMYGELRRLMLDMGDTLQLQSLN
jgi:arylsulfatase A-like enzyme